MTTNLTYHRAGDYLLPDLTPPEAPRIGVWGERRRSYLKKHKDSIYTGLLLSGELNEHLAEVDRTASEMVDRLIAEMAKREDITEALKASDQMAWVGAMNNIRNRAEEIVLREVVYA